MRCVRLGRRDLRLRRLVHWVVVLEVVEALSGMVERALKAGEVVRLVVLVLMRMVMVEVVRDLMVCVMWVVVVSCLVVAVSVSKIYLAKIPMPMKVAVTDSSDLICPELLAQIPVVVAEVRRLARVVRHREVLELRL